MPQLRPFVPLHVHSYYSILDGQAPIKPLVDKAIANGMRGMALTDHGAMFGIKEFYNYVQDRNAAVLKELKALRKSVEAVAQEEQEAAKQKIGSLEKQLFIPILGMEAYCARRSRFQKDAQQPDPYHPNRSIDASGWHLVLLAKNLAGYHNLLKLTTKSWVEGEYYRPRIDRELLEEYHEGLIVSSACLGGEVPQHILAGNREAALETVKWYQNLFGEDYYLEIQLHKTTDPLADPTLYDKQKKVASTILELAQETGVKVIATNDSHFVNAEDAEAHDRLIALSTGRAIDDPKRMRYSKQEWFKTQEEMNEVFADYPDVLENTEEILNKVELYSIDSTPLMPHFPIPENFKDDNDYLRHLTYEGAKKKYDTPLAKEVTERIDMELGIIKSMGFPGYFLIVQDFIADARSIGVSVGPGRGSAAGSAVAYCLGITNIDPIKYDLLFERFLNPDRISMPDIDIDFDDEGRAEVLKRVAEKYGAEKVAHITTFGTMASKSAIKDVARTEGVPLPESDRLTKLIPDSIPDVKKVNIKAAIDYSSELQQAAVGPDKSVRNTLKYAQQLEGTVRNTGVHACGIIIGKTDISDVVPLYVGTDKKTGEKIMVTQYDGSVIEQTGLIKMDFLGLTNLSTIKEALEYIKQGRGITIDIDNIPLDDPATYALYSAGNTVGTFQFESPGMQKYLRELQPSTFEDLIAMNALYRPGPMDKIPSFIARKHGKEEINYEPPCMERYLKGTYGITIYQEQVMLLSRELADFTRGESDSLRKAMGKKKIDQMNALKAKFMTQGLANKHPKETLEKIWSEWEEFAKYAFNKSHATCYSLVAYQTAYLKANYPAEYMAAALSQNLNDAPEISKLMTECKRMQIGVRTPDVNESQNRFSVNQQGEIRFGLSAIKGVGSGAVAQIIEERNANGLFTDLFDFMERIDLSSCNRKTLESFVLSGAFDSFGIPREAYFAPSVEREDETFLQALVRYGNSIKEDKQNGGMGLFGDAPELEIPHPEIPRAEPWSDLVKLNKERELVGLYLSANPLEEYRLILDYYCNTSAENLNDLPSLSGKQVKFCGVVTKTFTGMTRNNTPYARITLEDASGTTTIPLFGDNYVKFGNYNKEGLYLLVQGSVQPKRWRPEELELAIRSIDLLPQVAPNLVQSVNISLLSRAISGDFVSELVDLVEAHKGSVPMYLHLSDQTGTVKVSFTGVSITPGSWVVDFIDKYQEPDNGVPTQEQFEASEELISEDGEESIDYLSIDKPLFPILSSWIN